jgi:hypothetical protein
MKKVLVIALFVLGMCNLSVFGMVQEIILIELYSIIPLDDPEDDAAGQRPDPNRFRAFSDGNHLSIDAQTDMPAYVEVIDPETGEIVAEDGFEGETTISIPEEGDYEVYIYTESGTVLMGEFSVE